MNGVVTSVVAQIIIAIIPIVGIVIGGVVIFFYLLWRHKQIILLIKSNNYNPSKFNIRLFSLLTGILLTGIGLVLTILFILIEFELSYTLLAGLIPFIIGISLILFYRFLKNEVK